MLPSWCLPLLAVLLWIPAACGLQCFQCESTISMEDCFKRKEVVTCAPGENRCGTMVLQGTVYSMKCFKLQACADKVTENKACQDGSSDGDNCGIKCCSWNLCNDGRSKPGKDSGSLKCHRCLSSDSWQDCSKRQVEATCNAGEDRCMKMMLHTPVRGDNVNAYAKTCAPASMCGDSGACRSVSTEQGNSTCQISCCSSDFCNQEKTLTCFECASYESLAECEEKQRLVTCHPHKDRCATRAVTQGSFSQFLKYCATKASCEEDLCTRRSTSACRLQCCEGSVCNEKSVGGALVPSTFSLIACAVALLWS